MKVVIVYESMFGSTRRVAEHIAQGIREHHVAQPHEVVVRRVGDVTPRDLAHADLLVVGAPTHAHGLPRPTSRAEAERWTSEPTRGLILEPGAGGDGVREWLEAMPRGTTLCGAFDTRADIPKPLSGAASHSIARRLSRTGRAMVLAPESFRVTTDSHPEDAELRRSVTWGKSLAMAAHDLRQSRLASTTVGDGPR